MAGMIVKCAESDALRFAFPNVNGGLYTQEEITQVVDMGAIANQVRLVENAPAQIAQASPPTTAETEAAPTELTAPRGPQDEVADIVTGAGFTFDQFKRWAIESGNLLSDAPVDAFADMQPELARRFARARVGMVQGIKKLVEG
jgi:hypothetical protein